MSQEKAFTVLNKLGLHARPAAMFVQVTNKHKGVVRVIKGGREVDGKSIMGIMMLAAERGSQITVILEGEDGSPVLKELTSLFEKKFDEE